MLSTSSIFRKSGISRLNKVAVPDETESVPDGKPAESGSLYYCVYGTMDLLISCWFLKYSKIKIRLGI